MTSPLFGLFADAAARQPGAPAISADAAAPRGPGAPAISAAGGDLSYRVLARQVGGLAAGLRSLLPGGGRVALNLRKSPTAIVAMLACLRAGLAYVPIDPLAPLARRRAVLADSGAAAILLDERSAGEWSSADPAGLEDLAVVAPAGGAAGPGGHDLGWHDLGRLLAAEPRPPVSVGPDDLAYVLYTSGSTGAPKGVEITHGNAGAFVGWGLRSFGLGPGDRVAVHAPLHFDLPVFDVFVGLAAGATLCLAGEHTAMFPVALLRFLEANRVSVLYAVPTAYVGLVQQAPLAGARLERLRLLLYAGEEFHPTPLAQLVEAVPQARVVNLYGPVETNVVTAHEVTPADLARPRIPIGRPVAHARILLLDGDDREVTEPGVEGEIVVGGPSVSPGYLGDPALTARTRVRLALPGGPRDCYRTGDYGRWDAEGLLHFLGRRDGLVKTRGHRVEVGDVEAALVRHPDLASAVVVPVPHPQHTQVLRAVVAPRPRARPEPAALLRWCRAELPAYMVPVAVEVRDDLPRTSTGKVDRVAVGRMSGAPS